MALKFASKTFVIALVAMIISGTTLLAGPVNTRIKGIYNQYDESAVVAPASAPKGYRLVYLTHYGRHGARYVEKAGEYDKVLKPLQKAQQEGNLTPAGQALLEQYLPMYQASVQHIGELTDLGQAQHRGIATRMYEGHRQLLSGNVRIEARSSNLERTMLSMLAFCNTLQSLNPQMKIHADAPVATIHTINPHSVDSKHITPYDLKCRHRDFYADFMQWGPDNIRTDALMDRLFKDASKTEMTPEKRLSFANALFTIACAADGMDSPQADYFQYFTTEELSALAQWDNMFYYKAKGPGYNNVSKRNWSISKYILEDFINNAEQDMKDGIAARLRFGHDGCIMALFCLMEIDGWSTEAESLDKVWDVWDISRVPMASNIQIDFWQNAKGDILICPRYNERPLQLPIDQELPGLYSWDKFKQHYLKVIAEATALLETTPENN